MKPLGIKVKVALATSVTSIVMIALVTVVQMRRMQEDFTKVLFTQQTGLINRTAQEIDDKLTMLVDVLVLTAKKQPADAMGSIDKLNEFYAGRASLALFDDLLLLNTKGDIIVDQPHVPGRLGVNAADREYFKEVMRTRKPLISDPVLGKTSHQPVVQIAAPVLDKNGEVTAVLLGVLRLYKDNVLGNLRTAKVGKTGYYFAVTRDPNPVYVLYPQMDRLLKPRPKNANPATTRALEEGFEGTAISTNSYGVKAFNSYKNLQSVDWILCASLPVEEAFEPFDGLLYRLAVWSFLASLVAAALIGWLTTRLLSPLVDLRDSILTLSKDVSRFTPLPANKEDEIGQLTLAFNELMQERLAADQRLKNLIEFAPNAIVVVDQQGRIETFNREAERCFGYRRDEVVGQPLEVLTPVRLRRDAEGRDLDWFAAGAGLALDGTISAVPAGVGLELWGLRKDGSEFPIQINLSAVRSDQGTKILSMISDVTERFRLQQEVEARAVELEEERDRAEAANRAKSDFVANMSHEIRTPLNAVLGMAYLLGNTPLTAEQRKYLTMVRVSGQSLLAILNDVLDFSKIEARRMELAPTDFDLDEVMSSLGTTMTMSAGEKELELAIAVEPDVPKRLFGDALRLQQVLINLASNAIKFTPAGEVVVAVALDRRNGETARIRFEVRDSGIGMTPAQLAQLFTAFSQGDESITRRFGGTGLGLAISQHLVRLMGGDIAVTSTAGVGSSFTFTLPFEVLEGDNYQRRLPALGPLRLLVADDNQTSRRLIGKLIKAWGWESDEVDSGAAAVDLYRRRQAAGAPYDVVLADWHMAGMSGLDMARAIRAAADGEQQPIVVMVNAFARERLEEISTTAEADVVLMKPITGSNLFDALHQALTAQGGREEPSVANAGIAGILAGWHFLLVEDNLLNQAVARGILEHAGATLDVVGDGQQAVDLLRSQSAGYDIVLMDMQMPVMDGFSATRVLRKELRLTLPVIAMTAGVMASERERCVAAGISDFIAKPVVVEEMMTVIQRHLPAQRRVVAPPPPAAPPAAVPATTDTQPVTVPAADVMALWPAPVRSPAAPTQAPALAEASEVVFSMESLMRVMGRDAKGRGVLVKIVSEALANGSKPVQLAEEALREGRPADAAKVFHSMRGSVGIMGTKRLISASQRFEAAVGEGRLDALPGLLADVDRELQLVLVQARDWLATM